MATRGPSGAGKVFPGAASWAQQCEGMARAFWEEYVSDESTAATAGCVAASLLRAIRGLEPRPSNLLASENPDTSRDHRDDAGYESNGYERALENILEEGAAGEGDLGAREVARGVEALTRTTDDKGTELVVRLGMLLVDARMSLESAGRKGIDEGRSGVLAKEAAESMSDFPYPVSEESGSVGETVEVQATQKDSKNRATTLHHVAVVLQICGPLDADMENRLIYLLGLPFFFGFRQPDECDRTLGTGCCLLRLSSSRPGAMALSYKKEDVVSIFHSRIFWKPTETSGGAPVWVASCGKEFPESDFESGFKDIMQSTFESDQEGIKGEGNCKLRPQAGSPYQRVHKAMQERLGANYLTEL